jgi:hypothetical protein
MSSPIRIFLPIALSFFIGTMQAQNRKSSLSVTFGNAFADFKVGWYEIDNESFDDHDVEQLSFSAGIKYQRQIKDNVSFRMRTGYSRIDLYEYQNKNGAFSSAESRQYKLQLALGVVFALSERKFSLFGGFELPLYTHGRVRTEFIRSIDAVSFDEHIYSTIPSGFTAGIAPLMGFCYNFAKRFFCETEFSAMCLYGKTGGKTRAIHAGHVVTTQDALKGIFFEPRVALGVGVKL